MTRRKKIISALAIAGAALYWLNAGIYLGYEVVPAGTAFWTYGTLSHDIMVCRYFDLAHGFDDWPAWPPGTAPDTLLPDGTKPYVASFGCPGRWPWQTRALG